MRAARYSFTLAVVLGLSAVTAGRSQTPRTAPTETATFAAGCFCCVEEAFDKVAGVIATSSGYTAGRTANPTYDQVSAGSGATSMPSMAVASSAIGAVSIVRGSTSIPSNSDSKPKPRRRASPHDSVGGALRPQLNRVLRATSRRLRGADPRTRVRARFGYHPARR